MFKYILWISICLCLNGVAKSSPDSTNPVIKAIQVEDSNSLFGASLHRIIYVDSFVVYQIQYRFDSVIHRMKIDSITNEPYFVAEHRQSGTKNRYFVFHQDSSYGLNFDSYKLTAGSRLHVDSVLIEIIGTNGFENTLSQVPDSIIWNEQRTGFSEVYIQKASRDTPEAHLRLFFSNVLNHLEASLNPILDSAKKMKFYKYEIDAKELMGEDQKQISLPFVMRLELKEILLNDPGEILGFIHRYKINTRTD